MDQSDSTQTLQKWRYTMASSGGVDSTSPEQQTGGTRALSMGGATPSDTVNTIKFANISTNDFAVR